MYFSTSKIHYFGTPLKRECAMAVLMLMAIDIGSDGLDDALANVFVLGEISHRPFILFRKTKCCKQIFLLVDVIGFNEMIVEKTGNPFLEFKEASNLLRYTPVTSWKFFLRISPLRRKVSYEPLPPQVLHCQSNPKEE